MQASPSKPEAGVGTCNLYFKAPAAPFPDNILYLNGTGQGLVNNCCFPSTVAPSYAPPGQVRSLSQLTTQFTSTVLGRAESTTGAVPRLWHPIMLKLGQAFPGQVDDFFYSYQDVHDIAI
jgi:hypothetical protein